MLTCPDCRSINPPQHNFCQSCGRSLNHHICRSCGADVDFDTENCPQCNGITGTYWRAIIELAHVDVSQNVDPALTPLDLASKQPQLEPEPNPWNAEFTAIVADSNPSIPSKLPPLMVVYNTEPNPWEATSATAPNLNVHPEEIELDFESNLSDSGEIVSPDFSQTVPTVGQDLGALNLVPNSLVANDEARDKSNISVSLPSVNTYLDRASNGDSTLKLRYRQIDPVVIQLLAPGDSCQSIAIDRQPYADSPLETLMKQDPIAFDRTTTLGTVVENQPLAPEDYRQWQSWNAHDIPYIARAYIALQGSLPGTIPAIKDGWNEDGKTITLVEDRSHWTLLLDRWNEPQISSSQIIYWLDRLLKMWVDLEPWKMRQSLLEVNNLLLDEDSTICLQRLCPEPSGAKLKLADLAKLWRKLFDRSGSTPSPTLASSIAAMETGELARIEEMRSRLQQIAYELEPKYLSAPLQISASAELTNNVHNAPTLIFAKKPIDLEDAAATHTGKKRDHNEDCFGIVSKVERSDSPKGRNVSTRGLYILCDGMGGHAGGEIASAMTVDLLRDYFAIHWGDTLPDEETIREGIIATNEAVHDLNQKNQASGNARMGTTLVLVLVQDRDIVVAHVGDSRCYAITPSQGSIQLTIDHEVGQREILRGVDPDIAYGRADSYQLTQAIGPRDRNYIDPDIRFFELQEDTLILLASDGLTDNQLLETHWLTNVAPLLSPQSNLQDGVDRLIDFANEYNGHDNITALVVRARLG